MPRQFRNVCVAVLLGSAVAACGGGGGGGNEPVVVPPPAPPPPPPPARIEDSFGAGFAGAFRGDPNGVPVNPADGDLTVSFTTDPVAVP